MNRYRITSKGYKWDRLLINFMFLSFLLIGTYIAYRSGFDFRDRPIVYCNGPGYCDNPLLQPYTSTRPIYCPYDWCVQTSLAPGVYGEQPPTFIKHPFLTSAIILLIIIAINHYVHNSKYKTVHFGFNEHTEAELEKYKRWIKKAGLDIDNNKNNKP